MRIEQADQLWMRASGKIDDVGSDVPGDMVFEKPAGVIALAYFFRFFNVEPILFQSCLNKIKGKDIGGRIGIELVDPFNGRAVRAVIFRCADD